MKRLWSLLLVSLAALSIALGPRIARAADAEAAKLEALGKALGYTLKTTAPASPIDTGGAAILVNAPIAEVRKVVTSYGSYQKFLRPFDQSKVLSKRKGVSEVYLQVPILHGAMRIWTVAELSAPVKKGDEEVIVGRFKRGNVADFRSVWRLRAVDADHTVLKLEILVDPNIPVPSSLVTKQLRIAAEKGVTGVRDRAQAAVAAKRPAAPVAAAPAPAQPATPPSAPEASPRVPTPPGEPPQQASEPRGGEPAPAPLPPESDVADPVKQQDVAKR
ncbi:MAG: hypothetical protein IT372_32170 [Polyangiaceae bacterium]|nr:hypothetical protein [Polyangiaceae bacterium]